MERHYYDENQPTGSMSLANLRNTLRGLYQADLMPLRPRAKFMLDDMEYSTDASAQAQWSGTGCTVTSESSTVEVGSYSVKCVVDGTGNRTLTNTQSFVLDAFESISFYEQSSSASTSFQMFLSDGSNESYWDVVSTSGSFGSHTLTLASPDSNNGTDADLSAITSWGFKGLDASVTYYFDDVRAVVGMKVAVEGTESGDFYKNVYLGKQPLSQASQASPTITAPSSNPRIDILTINSSGALAFVTGSEGASPSPDWSSLGSDVMPIALVYCKTTMTKVLDYEDKDTDSNQGYIYSDLRPFLRMGAAAFTDLTDTPSSLTANKYIQVAADGNSLVFVDLSQTFLSLTDTPSSFSGQALKHVRVNSGASALEFHETDFLDLGDTPSSFSGQGGKFPSVNSGASALEFVSGLRYEVFTSNGTFNVPSWCSRVYVSMCGGGGGGGGGWNGGGSGYGQSGAGGGGGAATVMIPYDVTPSGSVSVSVGSGGSGGAANVNGSAGGNSMFDGSGGIVCNGGNGGTRGNNSGDATPAGGSGGSGASGAGEDAHTTGGTTGGTIKGYIASGATGGDGLSNSAGTTYEGGGGGGSCFGEGGAGGANNAAGSNASVGYGGGGGGGGGQSYAGGNGKAGIVIVYY